MKVSFKQQQGFTLLELLVSISIFAFMTALLVAKYGTFNQTILLKNLAYDVALTIRNAQSYGLNVRSANRNTNDFSGNTGGTYGVFFDLADTTHFVTFVDRNGNGRYDDKTDADGNGVIDEFLSQTTIKRGSYISDICVDNVCISGSSHSTGSATLSIAFKRPNPNAIIVLNTEAPAGNAVITLKSNDGGVAKVSVNSVGQIAVEK